MSSKNIHLEDDFLEFVKSEAKRREVHEAVIIREIVSMGEPKYRRKHNLESK